MKRALLLVFVLAACGSHHPAPTSPPPRSPVLAAPAPTPPPPPDAAPAPPPPPATPIADQYRDVAAKIVAAATADDAAWQRLRGLTDTVGNRLSGTKQLDQAIAWAEAAMKADGLDTSLEPVKIPHWVRGAESAKLVAPIDRDLVMLGLGDSIGTPRKGITAPVVRITSWDDLTAHAADVKGKIVFFDTPMLPWTPERGTQYGELAGFRWAGASQAAKLGAVAMLIRSVTARSLRTPHTGALGYDEKLPKIPAAAITTEDADLIHRLLDAGKEVKVHLQMSAKMLPDVPSNNVIGELKGSASPDQVVVLGAHLDSWDVGQGAQDDGAGCAGVMTALRVIHQLGLTPNRTIRVVLFVNEENGLRGGLAYAKDHAAELAKHVLAIEMDLGAFAPWGFDVDDALEPDVRAKTAGAAERLDRMTARVTDIESLLASIGASKTDHSESGADVTPLAIGGVPALGMMTDPAHYFDYHHTQADTLDKVDPKELAGDVAALAVMAYVVADMPGRLDDP